MSDQTTETEFKLTLKWTISRGRATYGYTVVTLFEGFFNEKKVAACNGGGYDMAGTVMAAWLAERFADRFLQLTKPVYCLSFHSPKADPRKVVPDPADGRTVAEREAAGVSFGLERHQAALALASNVPTAQHRIVCFDGGAGLSHVERVAKSLGVWIRQIYHGKKLDIYIATVSPWTPSAAQ